ncbi:MAG: glycosyltransferase [Candidatus Altiarchaeota archaeon]
MEISVIVPAFNEESCIETSLKSICSQNTNSSYELIVADCMSEDKTAEIAKKYADKVVYSKRRSIAIARNTGAKFSKGEYLVFIDADTLIPENYLSKVMEKFLDKELLAFSASFSFPKKEKKFLLAEKITNSYLEFRDKINSAILLGFNTCVRREAFYAVKGFRDVPLEDGDFAVRLRKKGKIRYFTDFFVITSSRRLEEMGILGTLQYYFELDLATRSPMLKKFLTHKNYLPLRINEVLLEREFLKIYKKREVAFNAGSLDANLREYVKEKAEVLLKTIKIKEFNQSAIRKISNRIIRIANSIAKVKMVQRITKRDVDEAMKIITPEMKNEFK